AEVMLAKRLHRLPEILFPGAAEDLERLAGDVDIGRLELELPAPDAVLVEPQHEADGEGLSSVCQVWEIEQDRLAGIAGQGGTERLCRHSEASPEAVGGRLTVRWNLAKDMVLWELRNSPKVLWEAWQGGSWAGGRSNWLVLPPCHPAALPCVQP